MHQHRIVNLMGRVSGGTGKAQTVRKLGASGQLDAREWETREFVGDPCRDHERRSLRRR